MYLLFFIILVDISILLLLIYKICLTDQRIWRQILKEFIILFSTILLILSILFIYYANKTTY